MTVALRSAFCALLLSILMFAAPALARPVTYPMPDRELMVPVEGGRIYVRINGNLDGPNPPIVLAHGGPGGTHAGLMDALELSDSRAVILYDQLDSGRSDQPNNPANWRVGRFVDELDAIRAALGIRRWYVLGHSWGGTIALEYGARRPVGLAGVVLASPLVSTRSWIDDAKILVARLPEADQRTLAACDRPGPPPVSTCALATTQFYSRFNRREPASAARIAYRNPQDRGINSRLYETMWGKSEFVSTGSLKGYDGEPLLARLDGSSTLFIVGQYDEARPTTAASFAERVTGSELAVVPGAAHGIFSDRPDETVGLIRAWLARQDSRARQQAR